MDPASTWLCSQTSRLPICIATPKGSSLTAGLWFDESYGEEPNGFEVADASRASTAEQWELSCLSLSLSFQLRHRSPRLSASAYSSLFICVPLTCRRAFNWVAPGEETIIAGSSYVKGDLNEGSGETYRCVCPTLPIIVASESNGICLACRQYRDIIMARKETRTSLHAPTARVNRK